MPQKACEGCFCTWWHVPQNRTYSFLVLFPLKSITWFPSKCPTFFCSKILKCTFFHLILKVGDGVFQEFRHKKVGHFEGKSRDRFQGEKNQKWIGSILGHFKIFEHMSSRAKYILHIVFGVYQGVSRGPLRKYVLRNHYVIFRINDGWIPIGSSIIKNVHCFMWIQLFERDAVRHSYVDRWVQ